MNSFVCVYVEREREREREREIHRCIYVIVLFREFITHFHSVIWNSVHV